MLTRVHGPLKRWRRPGQRSSRESYRDFGSSKALCAAEHGSLVGADGIKPSDRVACDEPQAKAQERPEYDIHGRTDYCHAIQESRVFRGAYCLGS